VTSGQAAARRREGSIVARGLFVRMSAGRGDFQVAVAAQQVS